MLTVNLYYCNLLKLQVLIWCEKHEIFSPHFSSWNYIWIFSIMFQSGFHAMDKCHFHSVKVCFVYYMSAAVLLQSLQVMSCVWRYSWNGSLTFCRNVFSTQITMCSLFLSGDIWNNSNLYQLVRLLYFGRFKLKYNNIETVSH